MIDLVDRTTRFVDADHFFERGGSGWMKLSRDAAIEVVDRCTANGVSVWGLEAGIWHRPGFEARLDGIWDSDGLDGNAEVVNVAAANFINEQPTNYDTVIVQTRPAEAVGLA